MPDKTNQKRLIKTWGSTAALFGVGMVPCPDCGVPLIIKFWPVPALLVVSKLFRNRISAIEEERNDSSRPVDQDLS